MFPEDIKNDDKNLKNGNITEKLVRIKNMFRFYAHDPESQKVCLSN